VNDPLLLIPAMAYVTRNLGFGVTCAVSYEHPYRWRAGLRHSII
jgi:alkanesulfonate monooxygenase SsuD/methylene tetrahydromethanopterin reductase-like flavin-dependent oxidoreductase (luciferase family)